jgi:hypothetical protein
MIEEIKRRYDERTKLYDHWFDSGAIPFYVYEELCKLSAALCYEQEQHVYTSIHSGN